MRIASLISGRELDRMLRWPRGRSVKLARAGKLPSVTMPDGEIRFDVEEVEAAIRLGARPLTADLSQAVA